MNDVMHGAAEMAAGLVATSTREAVLQIALAALDADMIADGHSEADHLHKRIQRFLTSAMTALVDRADPVVVKLAEALVPQWDRIGPG